MKPKDGLFAVGRRFTGLCLLCLMLLGGGKAVANSEVLTPPPSMMPQSRLRLLRVT